MASARWLEQADGAEWDRELQALPDSHRDVYFERAYVSLYADDGRAACCFVYTEGPSRYLFPFLLQEVPGAPGRFDVTTAYGYGGPVVLSADESFAARAHAAFRLEAKERGVIAELIKFHPLLDNHTPLQGALDRILPMCPIVYADLSLDAEHRWSDVYTHANRKNINKARRAGVSVSMDAGDEEWDAFRRLYATTMRANQAASFYSFPDTYFEKIRESMASHHRLVTARHEGAVVAGLLVLLGPRFAHCHLIGTERDAMNLGTNNLLHHELIVWAAENGYERLLIGGGRSDRDDDSLLRFKRNFSDAVATLFVGETVEEEAAYRSVCDRWLATNPDRTTDGRLLAYRT